MNSLVIANKYSCCKLGNWAEYQHRFGNCEVTEGKIALRFEVAETTGLEGTPKSTEVVLQSFFCLESRGRFCCPEWSRDFRWSSLRPVPGAEGIASVTEEPLGSEGSTRLTVTPEPGYTVTCGFDTPENPD